MSINTEGTFVGLCYVGRNVKNGEYLLLRFRENHMVGPVIHIPRLEMMQDGMNRLLHYLQNVAPSDCVPFCFHDPATNKAMLKLKRDHLLVSVRLLKGDPHRIKITPLRGERGWAFTSFRDEVTTFSLPMTNEEFVKALDAALEVAS